jgi:hypothetical protein
MIMPVLRAISIALIMLAAAAAAVSHGKQEKAIEKKNVVPFVLAGNKTILPVQVGKARPLKIILDSGMGWDGLLLFDPDLRDSLGLIDPRAMNIGGAGNGRGQTALSSASMSFSLGGMEFSKQRIVLLQGDHFKGFPNDGVIGYSLFGHFALEMDFDRSLMTLHEIGKYCPDPSWTEVPIFFKENNIPWLAARIAVANEDPVPLSCYIDFASSEAIELLLRPGQKFTIPETTGEVLLGRGLSGDITGRRGKIAKVIIGPHEIPNVQAAFVDAAVRSRQPGADGIIASNLLRRFNLIFDYAGKKLYIKPNARIHEPF